MTVRRAVVVGMVAAVLGCDVKTGEAPVDVPAPLTGDVATPPEASAPASCPEGSCVREPLQLQWTYVEGGADSQDFTALALDAAGQPVLAVGHGGTYRMYPPPPGADPVQLVKLDAQGRPLWRRGPASTQVRGLHQLVVQPGSGALYATGSLGNGDPYGTLRRFEADGTGEQELEVTGLFGWFPALAADAAGHLLVSRQDVYLWNEPGSERFQRTLRYGAPQSEPLYAFAGLSGWNDARGWFTFELGWTLELTPEGDAVVGGQTYGTQASLDGAPVGHDGRTEGFVARLDPAGRVAWATSFEGAQTYLYQLKAAPDGAVVVFGSASDGVSAGGHVVSGKTYFLASLAADGSVRWMRAVETAAEWDFRLAVSPTGHVALTGNASCGAELSAFAPDGTLLGTRTLSDPRCRGGVHFRDVAFAQDGIYVAGSFAVPLNLSTGTLMPTPEDPARQWLFDPGGADAVVFKFVP